MVNWSILTARLGAGAPGRQPDDPEGPGGGDLPRVGAERERERRRERERERGRERGRGRERERRGEGWWGGHRGGGGLVVVVVRGEWGRGRIGTWGRRGRERAGRRGRGRGRGRGRVRAFVGCKRRGPLRRGPLRRGPLRRGRPWACAEPVRRPSSSVPQLLMHGPRKAYKCLQR